MYRPRARAAPEGRVRGCAVPSTMLLLLAYLAYLALGTGVFWTLEGRAAQDSSRSFQRDKWELLQNFTCLDRPALDSLIRDVVQAYKNGASLLSNTTSMGRWELVGSFFFSVSTITTIGYGNLSPNTMAARLFCIFFALVGIPLNLVVLNRLGHLMQQGVNHCASRLGGTWQDPDKARWLAGSGALLSGLLLFLLLPPLLFSHMEGWSYTEGFYFAFITLSTVGFGDYVIGMNPSQRYPLWYKNVVSLWILFGMAWLALISNSSSPSWRHQGGYVPAATTAVRKTSSPKAGDRDLIRSQSPTPHSKDAIQRDPWESYSIWNLLLKLQAVARTASYTPFFGRRPR
ncbi:LOW QUALITY PROTEIN: potassium channel subfamily K member 17 [Pan paniscus]|uniref:LOW QUALITY PROTEIN: potassium channel subfamily K member 17 n=1 Tax=Pan troglodytes TaxID=9598 RepID=UPI0006C996BC|nr:LOW QUALITY PROTEIN: potassium channel subfamily K member 17 [Pan troglodytes]